MVSSFISYLGPFNKVFRQLLLERDLRGACVRLGIPATADLDVAKFLVDDGEVAEWRTQACSQPRRLPSTQRLCRLHLALTCC